MAQRKFIFLDRDGVLNRMVVHAEHGTIDSPLNVSEVELFEAVPADLKKLNDLGYELFIITNQPAAAKKKTTVENLNAVHAKIVTDACKAGAKINVSKICYHQSSDLCLCRKPSPQMILDILNSEKNYDLSNCWMVGDGITDIQAGLASGLKTCFLGPQKCDACKVMEEKKIAPDFWSSSLNEFVKHIELLR